MKTLPTIEKLVKLFSNPKVRKNLMKQIKEMPVNSLQNQRDFDLVSSLLMIMDIEYSVTKKNDLWSIDTEKVKFIFVPELTPESTKVINKLAKADKRFAKDSKSLVKAIKKIK